MNLISTTRASYLSPEATVFMWDYDGVMGPPTIRLMLAKNNQRSVQTVAKQAKAAFVVTNSDASETAQTLDREAIDAGLNFIGEHGMVGKFSAKGPWEFHPDLTVDRTVLPELSARAKELIRNIGMQWTEKGEDLQRGLHMIKVEEKMASFALVRTMNGFRSHEKAAFIKEMDSVTSLVMQTLAEEFGLEKEGWSKTIGADAQEFAEAGFSKHDGVVWLMERCGINAHDHQLVMHEDSNADLLEKLHQDHGCINIGVGEKYHSPESASYVFGSVTNVEGFWKYQGEITRQLEEGEGLNFLRAVNIGNRPSQAQHLRIA